MTMRLRDRNVRYAAMKALAELVSDAMEVEKGDHIEELTVSSEDSGSTRWNIELGGVPVASVSLSAREAAPRVVDEDALVRHLVEQGREDMLQLRVRDWAKKELLSSIVAEADGAGVTDDGELVPGVAMSAPGRPYASLRWAKDKGDTRGTEAGRLALLDALRAGELDDLLGDVLPQITEAGAEA